MNRSDNPLAVVIHEIEEIDDSIACLNTEVMGTPGACAAPHARSAVRALRRYRERLVEDRDEILYRLGSI